MGVCRYIALGTLVVAGIVGQAGAQFPVYLDVNASVDKETYYPYEAVIVSVATSGSATMTVPCWGGLGYTLDGVHEWPPVGACLGFYTKTVSSGSPWTDELLIHETLGPPDAGPHSVTGRLVIFEEWFHGPQTPATFEVLAPPEKTGDVLIDFDTVPGDAPMGGGPLSDIFRPWGVSFNHCLLANPSNNWYLDNLGPGRTIAAILHNQAYTAVANVRTASGRTVTMVGEDEDGNIVASATSGPADYPAFSGPLVLHSETPIYKIDWTPSEDNCGMQIDNLFLVRSSRKPGDADADGDVDLDDFILLKMDFGMSYDGDPVMTDFDGDGTVGLNDFVILKQNFGAGIVP